MLPPKALQWVGNLDDDHDFKHVNSTFSRVPSRGGIKKRYIFRFSTVLPMNFLGGMFPPNLRKVVSSRRVGAFSRDLGYAGVFFSKVLGTGFPHP